MPIAEPVTRSGAKPVAAPPKKSATSRPTPSRTPSSDDVRQERTEAVAGVLQLVSGVLSTLGQYADAATFEMHGGTLATEVAALADKSESLARRLDNLGTIAPYAGLATVCFSIGAQLATNHKMIPLNAGMAFGAVPPDVLDGEMRVKLTRQAMAMQDAQKQRERELRDELARREQELQEEQESP